MRALVTGANGFVGRHLVAHLEAEGDTVSAVDREVDVSDTDAVAHAIVAARPDAIYHLAALSHVGDSWREPAEVARVNVGGTRHVLDAAARRAPDALLLVVSSADVFGVVSEDDLPLDEGHATAPVSPYGQSKRDAELLAGEAARGGQRVIVARPFNHVGPGQAPTFVVPALASRLFAARAAGRREIAVGDLSARRDFTDVRDVVRAYRLLATLGDIGATYHVASGVDVSIADVADRLIAMISPGSRVVVDPDLVRPVEVPALRGDATKLRNATGWTTTITLDQSLRDVVDALAERGPGG
ncbi:MAG: GDP-mannose 4,6-dehydratase [Acidimicrobiales bacterium]